MLYQLNWDIFFAFEFILVKTNAIGFKGQYDLENLCLFFSFFHIQLTQVYETLGSFVNERQGKGFNLD